MQGKSNMKSNQSNLREKIFQLEKKLEELEDRVKDNEQNLDEGSDSQQGGNKKTHQETYDQWRMRINQRIKENKEDIFKGSSNSEENRKCTDLFFCILILTFSLVMLILSIIGWRGQNFKKLKTAYDAEGKACGQDYFEYPYLYFAIPQYESLWKTVCVKKCPFGNETQVQCMPNKYVPNCNKTVGNNQNQNLQIYNTNLFFHVACAPTSDYLRQTIVHALSSSSLSQQLFSLLKTWPIIVCAIPVSILMALMLMLLIRLEFSYYIIYFLLILSALACPALGVYLFITPANSVAGSNFKKMLGNALNILLINFGIIILYIVIKHREKVKIACKIMNISVRFLEENYFLIVLPLICFFIFLGFMTLSIFQAIGFYSMGTMYRHQKSLPFQHFIFTWKVKVIFFFHIIHIIWVICFLMEINDFMVSGTSALWYFSSRQTQLGLQDNDLSYQDKKEKEKQLIFQQNLKNFRVTCFRFFRFHIGSVALGAFFQALFGIAKYIYLIITPSESDKVKVGIVSSLVQAINIFCCCCVKFIFNCLSNGTYTFVNITGQAFCHSSIDVICLKVKQEYCTPLIEFLSLLFSILFRVGITAVVVIIAYSVVKHVEPFKSSVPDATLFNILVGVTTFTVSSLFASLYSNTIHSIYVSFLFDLAGQQNQGRGRIDAYMNSLRENSRNGPENMKQKKRRMKKIAELQKLQQLANSLERPSELGKLGVSIFAIMKDATNNEKNKNPDDEQ